MFGVLATARRARTPLFVGGCRGFQDRETLGAPAEGWRRTLSASVHQGDRCRYRPGARVAFQRTADADTLRFCPGKRDTGFAPKGQGHEVKGVCAGGSTVVVMA